MPVLAGVAAQVRQHQGAPQSAGLQDGDRLGFAIGGETEDVGRGDPGQAFGPVDLAGQPDAVAVFAQRPLGPGVETALHRAADGQLDIQPAAQARHRLDDVARTLARRDRPGGHDAEHALFGRDRVFARPLLDADAIGDDVQAAPLQSVGEGAIDVIQLEIGLEHHGAGQLKGPQLGRIAQQDRQPDLGFVQPPDRRQDGADLGHERRGDHGVGDADVMFGGRDLGGQGNIGRSVGLADPARGGIDRAHRDRMPGRLQVQAQPQQKGAGPGGRVLVVQEKDSHRSQAVI